MTVASVVEIKDTGAERGRGVFARVAIAAGTTIEIAPVIVLPSDDSAKIRRTFLYNYFFQWGSQGKTAIVLGFGSLYNHSNRPNAKHVREFDKLQMRFVAMRDIAQGEEIFVNYLGDYEGRARNKEVWFS